MSQSFVLRCVLLGSCILASVAAVCFLRFGSISLPIAYLQGVPFLVLPNEVELGDCEPGTRHIATFTVTNFADNPIRIVGIDSGCPCLTLDELPIEISSHESQDVSIQAKVPLLPGNFSEPLLLFLDDGRVHSIALRIRARVLEGRSDGKQSVIGHQPVFRKRLSNVDLKSCLDVFSFLDQEHQKC